MSKALISQVGYLHNQCPKGKEWSGLLIYKILEGNIEEPEKFKIRAEQVYPMNLGEAGFTSFEAGNGWLQAFDQFPQIDPMNPQEGWRIGKIHSHHSMGVFHSPTDKGDLYDTAPVMPMYLSLIVNYASSTDCQLAIAIEAEETVTTDIEWRLKGWKEKKKEQQVKKSDNKRIYILNCDVEYEEDEWFMKRTAEIIEEAKPKYPAKSYPYTGAGNYSIPGFQHDHTTKKEDAKTTTEEGIYQRMLSWVSDLFTLGLGLTLTPSEALRKADIGVDQVDKDDYHKAFMNYYEHIWFPAHFAGTGISKQQVVEALQKFMKHHSALWIHGPMKKVLNDMKKRYESERKTVVR